MVKGGGGGKVNSTAALRKRSHALDLFNRAAIFVGSPKPVLQSIFFPVGAESRTCLCKAVLAA